MSVSITPSIIAVQMTSSLQDISISVNNPSCVISFASGEYLPTDPTFNSLHVTTDAEIGDDLDVLGDQYVEGTLEVGSTLILDAGLLGTTADFTDVHLAGNITNVNAITLNTTPANVPTSVGTLYYDEQDKTLSFILESATLQIGQEQYIICVNKTGSIITNGSVVYVNGAQGNRPTIALASTSDYAIANLTIGVVTHDIGINSEGLITISGVVRDLNTQSYNAGDRIYLSSVAGQFTKTRPSFGSARIAIGIVIKSHDSDGWIGIRINNMPYMFGDPTNGNYSGFEDSGFLSHYGTARAWEDLNFDVINSGGPAANVPDYVIINNIAYREFTSANNQRCSGSKELPHEAYIGTAQELIAHTHGFLKNGESAGTTGVIFTAYWEIRQSTGTTNGSVQLSATSAQLIANPNKVDLYSLVSFSGPIELGAQVSMTLARTGGNAGDFIPITYGFHYAKDSGGSRTATSK